MAENAPQYRPLLDDVRSVIRSLHEKAEQPVGTSLPKQYVEGFCDGMRLAASVLEAALDLRCRGCDGGWGLADNAHTRDERCQFGPAHSAEDLCHNGHPFEPGQNADAPDEPGDPRWCDVCGEARRSANSANPGEVG